MNRAGKITLDNEPPCEDVIDRMRERAAGRKRVATELLAAIALASIAVWVLVFVAFDSPGSALVADLMPSWQAFAQGAAGHLLLGAAVLALPGVALCLALGALTVTVWPMGPQGLDELGEQAYPVERKLLRRWGEEVPRIGDYAHAVAALGRRPVVAEYRAALRRYKLHVAAGRAKRACHSLTPRAKRTATTSKGALA